MEPATLIVMILIVYTLAMLSFGILFKQLKNQFDIYRANSLIRKEIARRKKMVEEMRANGDFHEWITIQQADVNGEIHNMHVCKKTGWCPKLQQFYHMHVVKAEMLKQEYKEKYEIYRNKKVKELSEKFNHSIEDMEDIVESVFDIKKQFAIKWIDENGPEVQNGNS